MEYKFLAGDTSDRGSKLPTSETVQFPKVQFLGPDFFCHGFDLWGLPTLWICAWQWAPANTAPQAKFSRFLGGIRYWFPNLNVKRSWGWHGRQPGLNGWQQRWAMFVSVWNSGADKGTHRHWTIRRVSGEWQLWNSGLSCWHTNFSEH